MRIIAGKKRGTKLLPPQGYNVRPTTDRVREAVFGSLQFVIADSVVLDLFAGSGAMGLEAVSRGAEKPYMVDSSDDSISIIKENVNKTGFEDLVEIVKKDYAKALIEFKNTLKFDIVFIDPPYESGYYQDAVRLLVEGGLIRPNGIVILESGEKLGGLFYGMEMFKEKKYGTTHITFLKRVQ
jgi:16S rRNA (guanine(966)-N(2))-methyltransferase RsmD